MRRLRRSIPVLVLLALSPFVFCARAAAQDGLPELAGRWNGAIEALGQVLEIRLSFEREGEGWRGSLSIPAQGLLDSPLSKIEREGTSLRFALPGVPGNARFEGEFSADGARIEGPFFQGLGRFRWHAASVAAAPSGLEGFDEWLEATRAAWKVPGIAVACVRGEQVLFVGGRGLRDVERGLPVTPSTLFAIGSCTKAFTALALDLFVAEGRADWDRPVRAYLPAFRLHERLDSDAVSLRDLVAHRTGLPRHDFVWYGRPELERRAVLERLPHLEPSAGLRERWQYNNLMYVVAGLVVEELGGGTWEDTLRARILEPLGMERTSFSTHDAERDADHALPYRLEDGQPVRIPYRRIENVGPAGSIQSSALDMARWVALWCEGGALGGRRIAEARALERLRTPAMLVPEGNAEADILGLGYAHGWAVHQYRGHLRVSHGGGIDGFSAMVSFVPDKGIGVVVLANVAGGLPELVSRHALDRLLALETRDWSGEGLARERAAEALEEQGRASLEARPDAPAPRPLGEYVGTYEHAGYGRLEVELEGGALRVRAGELEATLEPLHFEVFRFAEGAAAELEGQPLQFLCGFEGEIEGLRIVAEPALAPVVFTRRPDERLGDPELLARYAGTYQLAGMRAEFVLRGAHLELEVAGQPTYRLKAVRPLIFELEQLPGFRVRFEIEGEGPARAAVFLQPNGVFRAERAPG